ncbi:unnamed protein product [Musa acuminata subsp. malaccensis]|uniref:(wild Malaysian banana) hypothetical protein n=1 Tax=Musa acuminata subsp. malaccensis TaxID=214687 RepID=A0A804JJI6_MUSAM|nr:unnamed protein product [Musa acuminata subsp. malaccensis]
MTPLMGIWNTWNHFYCDINETIIRELGTNILMYTRLAKLGYRYVNIGMPLTILLTISFSLDLEGINLMIAYGMDT